MADRRSENTYILYCMVFNAIFNSISVIAAAVHLIPFNSLPNDKMMELFKLKAFADDKLVVA